MMEPVRLGEGVRNKNILSDLALELAAKSAGFRRSLPEGIARSLATLVRAMNCYYSNLIEGHDTHPVDIERALKGDYSQDTAKRNLQLEAEAHIGVQTWIDSGGIEGNPTSAETIREIHLRFCEKLPDDLLWVSNPDTKERIRVVPGELRTTDVAVGRHIAISPGAVPRFLDRFASVFATAGKTELLIGTAAAHHRLLWIHPFADGNGRVARLMSYAMLYQALDTGGLWSVARGLARNEATYKAHLANCDLPRRNDLDGRGNLSEEALGAFTEFFLKICLDQVAFMESLVQPDRLRTRILIWTEEEIRMGILPAKSGVVLEALLYRGRLERNEIAGVLGVTDRQARRVTSALLDRGVIASESSRSPITLSFPASLASRWMPGLFPEKA